MTFATLPDAGIGVFAEAQERRLKYQRAQPVRPVHSAEILVDCRTGRRTVKTTKPAIYAARQRLAELEKAVQEYRRREAMRAEADRIQRERAARGTAANETPEPPPLVAIADAISATSLATGIDKKWFPHPTKERRFSHPRMFAMWLTKRLRHQLSTPAIGRAFGDRDHTTVMHALRKVEAEGGAAWDTALPLTRGKWADWYAHPAVVALCDRVAGHDPRQDRLPL